jgi:hypothetical protein
LGQAGELGAVAVLQTEAAAAPAIGIDRNAGSAELVDVAMDRAHSDFEFRGEFARAHAATRLQQDEDRQEAARKHFFQPCRK